MVKMRIPTFKMANLHVWRHQVIQLHSTCFIIEIIRGVASCVLSVLYMVRARYESVTCHSLQTPETCPWPKPEMTSCSTRPNTFVGNPKRPSFFFQIKGFYSSRVCEHKCLKNRKYTSFLSEVTLKSYDHLYVRHTLCGLYCLYLSY